MNTELLLAIADFIEVHPDLYNQRTFATEHLCGTMACVAGHAVLIDAAQRGLDVRWACDEEYNPLLIIDDELVDTYEIGSRARVLCGLTATECDELFDWAWRSSLGSKYIPTPAQAISVLRRLATTGIVDTSPPISDKPS